MNPYYEKFTRTNSDCFTMVNFVPLPVHFGFFVFSSLFSGGYLRVCGGDGGWWGGGGVGKFGCLFFSVRPNAGCVVLLTTNLHAFVLECVWVEFPKSWFNSQMKVHKCIIYCMSSR